MSIIISISYFGASSNFSRTMFIILYQKTSPSRDFLEESVDYQVPEESRNYLVVGWLSRLPSPFRFFSSALTITSLIVRLLVQNVPYATATSEYGLFCKRPICICDAFDAYECELSNLYLKLYCLSVERPVYKPADPYGVDVQIGNAFQHCFQALQWIRFAIADLRVSVTVSFMEIMGTRLFDLIIHFLIRNKSSNRYPKYFIVLLEIDQICFY